MAASDKSAAATKYFILFFTAFLSLHKIWDRADNLDEKEYFYYKTAVFLILSSCKKCTKSELYSAYDIIFSKATSNEIVKNKYYNVLHDYGEVKSVKYVVFIFRLLQKLHLAKPFLLLFSKV